jgi:RNA polymerase sigma-70 factor (ECF subfamily)
VLAGETEMFEIVMRRHNQRLYRVASDTADALEITEENVKVRLHRARALLRKSLYARAGMERNEAFTFHAVRCDRVVKNVFERIQKRGSKMENSATGMRS